MQVHTKSARGVTLKFHLMMAENVNGQETVTLVLNLKFWQTF
jgi:hypothetical protein